ncbi:hypothetical protein YW5DRAFT_03791 [Streptomyces sp. Ncost-T6T-1]|uniref:hypothetical protein n=1 Tax=Streptomyces sp. Ncost-T6T-1 TaxID=1100828 RepID=UPI00080569D6|nr:hypothetical protein [Streptomyces sp. Ncost-T6T-1]SBU91968.1 hypothetical protein YW5DRAFT_03791 [Streptomyces sp. Ncost-T6T-1]
MSRTGSCSAIGTRWRRRLAAGFDIEVATVFRYMREALDLMAVLAPSLAEAMETIRAKAYVILDGTLLPTDCAAADPVPLREHTRHGMNVQVLTDPSGRLL